MAGLLDFMNAMAEGGQNGAFATGMHPSKSLWNIPGLRDALMQQQMAAPQQQAPQQQQQQMPMQPMSVYPGGNSLAAYMRGRLPLSSGTGRRGPLSGGIGFGF